MTNSVKNIAFQPNLEEKTKTALHMASYIDELEVYRKNRYRPKNPLYYIAKLAKEVGELSEAALADEGSRRKVAKLRAMGVTPRERLIEELGDVITIAFLLAEQYDIPLSQLLDTGCAKLKSKRLKIAVHAGSADG